MPCQGGNRDDVHKKNTLEKRTGIAILTNLLISGSLWGVVIPGYNKTRLKGYASKGPINREVVQYILLIHITS